MCNPLYKKTFIKCKGVFISLEMHIFHNHRLSFCFAIILTTLYYGAEGESWREIYRL